MFLRMAKTWTSLGQTEPYWSVLSAEQYKRVGFEQHSQGFWKSGKDVVDVFQAFLARNGVALSEDSVCLELGCGVGRVTRWLAPDFRSVIALDVSPPHLTLAKSRLEADEIANVTFGILQDIKDLEQIPDIDVFFSVIVLQHNPPPVIRHMLSTILAKLKQGGIAYFQVPTYAREYSFNAGTYLSNEDQSGIEMHLLPQRDVFEVAAQNGCRALEVREDGWVGMGGWISSTFLLQKGDAQ
jgi:SAM-dependent methyltransferase